MMMNLFISIWHFAAKGCRWQLKWLFRRADNKVAIFFLTNSDSNQRWRRRWCQRRWQRRGRSPWALSDSRGTFEVISKVRWRQRRCHRWRRCRGFESVRWWWQVELRFGLKQSNQIIIAPKVTNYVSKVQQSKCIIHFLGYCVCCIMSWYFWPNPKLKFLPKLTSTNLIIALLWQLCLTASNESFVTDWS